MAFTSILRKPASALARLAIRLVRRQRSYQSAIFASLNDTNNLSQKPSLRPFVPTLRFSSASKKLSSDELLLRVIESEIQCAQETDDHDRESCRVERVRKGFPFKIQDNLRQQTISLERKYQGEVIEVEVHMHDLDDSDDGDSDRKANQSSIKLFVSVSKKNGLRLKFSCTAYPNEIAIDSLSVKNPEISEDQIAYEGPDFQDLDENLQKAFYKYLETRGIKPSTTNFLHVYMILKEEDISGEFEDPDCDLYMFIDTKRVRDLE